MLQKQKQKKTNRRITAALSSRSGTRFGTTADRATGTKEESRAAITQTVLAVPAQTDARTADAAQERVTFVFFLLCSAAAFLLFVR